MPNWFADSYKNLFFDLHTHSSARGVAEGFDADAWADRIKSLGVQAVSAFAVDGFGWRFYREGEHGWVHPGLPENLDLLGEIVSACHERDVRVIAYFNTMNSEPVAKYRPEFRELDVNGRPKSDYEIFNEAAICWLSSAFDEIFLPQVVDIATNYPVDALFFDGTYAHSACYCASCRQRYAAEMGRDIPVTPDDPGWSDYAIWAERHFDEIRDRIVDTVASIRPGTLVCVNWYAANRRPAVVKRPENMLLTLDLHPATQLFDASYQARSWSSQPTPWSCMNTAFLDWWGDWGVKPAVALKQECASILANGGRLFTGYQMYPDLGIHPGAETALRDMLGFVDERLHSVVGTEPDAEIAVLHPTTTYSARDPEIFTSAVRSERVPVGSYQIGLPDVYADETPVRGVHRMLLELGYDYQIVTENVLFDSLDRYKVVILPAERYVTDELIERLTAFADAGGVVIASYEPTRLSGELAVRWASFLGVTRDRDYEFKHAYVAQRTAEGDIRDPFLVRSAFTLAAPDDGTVSLADHENIYLRADGRPLLKTSPPGELSGYSAVTSRRIGNGVVLSFNFEPFSAYLRTNQWRLKSLFADLLQHAYPAPAVRVTAPGRVEVTLRAARGKHIVHLANHNGYQAVEEGTWESNDSVVPVHNVTVVLRGDGRPVRVTEGQAGRQLEAVTSGDTVSVVVPRVDIHTWLEVEPLA